MINLKITTKKNNMNTYNDNLHATVVTSLQNQELAKKTVYGQFNASMFTLYYAEGATITANEKLEIDTIDKNAKKAVRDQAISNSNISTNLLGSATQANQYMQLSVTNTSVCAANVQVAANAIVRLAGDAGNIYSIVNAADFDTEIYRLAGEIKNLMNDTAYDAELASQISMEASILTSEVTSGVVLTKAKATNAAMTNLLNITTSDFNTAAQAVDADHANIMAVSISEKQAEGNLEDINVEYKATNNAYIATNRLLNLNLRVKDLTNTSFNVLFDFIRSPFEAGALVLNDNTLQPLNNSQTYPVKDYYAIVVKDSKKYTFSITEAEALVNNKERCTHIDINSSVEKRTKKPSEPGTQGENVIYHWINQKIELINGTITLKDSDGDTIELGENYTVFVFAVYMDSYKKKINNFEDFLSAPSFTFCLTNNLEAVNTSKLQCEKIPVPAKPAALSVVSEAAVAQVGDTYEVNFTVPKDPNYDVEYRLMFLPYGDRLASGLLTVKSLGDLEKDVELLEKVAEEFDPKIAVLEAKLVEVNILIKVAKTEEEKLQLSVQAELIQLEINAMNKAKAAANKGTDGILEMKIDGLEAELIQYVINWESLPLNAPAKDRDKIVVRIVKVIAEILKLENELIERASKESLTEELKTRTEAFKADIRAENEKLKEYEAALNKSTISTREKKKLKMDIKKTAAKISKLYIQFDVFISQLDGSSSSQIGFIFNLPIAQQVPNGNWTSTQFVSEKSEVYEGKKTVVQTWRATFGPETTDNFGNRLMEKGKYIPVILSTTGVEIEDKHEVLDALSDFNKTPVFTYTN